MESRSFTQLALAAVLGLALAGAAAAEEDRIIVRPTGIDGPTALNVLKTLEGIWIGDEDHTGHHPCPVYLAYRVSAKGNTVEETFARGTKLEMLTVYYLDSTNNLHLTHFCATGNRPEMVLDNAASSPARLVFRFAGGAVNPQTDFHMHNGSITFVNSDQISTDWTTWKGGTFFSDNPVEFKRMPEQVDPER